MNGIAKPKGWQEIKEVCPCGCGETFFKYGKRGNLRRLYWGHHSRIREYRKIAEKILGRKLPRKIIVHHYDKDRENNTNGNLVVCENQKYHILLHIRQKAFEACGHANWRKCKRCKAYDDPKNLHISADAHTIYHNECNRIHQRLIRINRSSL